MPRRRKNAPLAKAAESIPASDRTLIALTAELQAAETAFNAGLAECEGPSSKPGDLEQFEEQSFDHIHTLLERMAAIPASGCAGAAAKAAWLCVRLAQSDVMPAEEALWRSLAADLARHQPKAVGPVETVLPTP